MYIYTHIDREGYYASQTLIKTIFLTQKIIQNERSNKQFTITSFFHLGLHESKSQVFN